jgi:hypothetical protein
MLTPKKELNFKDSLCPHCQGFTEIDFSSVKLSRHFLCEIYKEDKGALPEHPDELSDKEAIGSAWLYFHILSQGCLQYEVDSYFVRTYLPN